MPKLKLLTFATIFAACTPHAGAAEKKSTVDVSTAAQGAKLELSFKVVPASGLQINLDAPWKLELKAHDGLSFDQDTLVKKDLNETLTGFVVTTNAAPSKAAGDLDYSLIAFVCTNDKTSCYRDVHTGKASWSTAKK